jgi:hypothetical protein
MNDRNQTREIAPSHSHPSAGSGHALPAATRSASRRSAARGEHASDFVAWIYLRLKIRKKSLVQ